MSTIQSLSSTALPRKAQMQALNYNNDSSSQQIPLPASGSVIVVKKEKPAPFNKIMQTFISTALIVAGLFSFRNGIALGRKPENSYTLHEKLNQTEREAKEALKNSNLTKEQKSQIHELWKDSTNKQLDFYRQVNDLSSKFASELNDFKTKLQEIIHLKKTESDNNEAQNN